MADADTWLTPKRAGIVGVIVVLAVAGVIGAVAISHSGTQSQGYQELKGYAFVYHPGTNVTIVKQSFTDNMSRLSIHGPNGAIAWNNASGGSTNMAALVDYRTLGAKPGDRLVVKKRLQNTSYELPRGNSTIPAGPSKGSFVVLYHQKPAVTIVNVNVTDTSNLELAGPHGSVTWANASLGSKPTSATFAWNRHALGATAGDNVTLVRVDPQTGNRTTIIRSVIP